MVDPDRPQMTV